MTMYPAPIQAVVDGLLHQQDTDPEWDGPTDPALIWWSAASRLHAWARATIVLYPLERQRLANEISFDSFDGCSPWAQTQLTAAAQHRANLLAPGSAFRRGLGDDLDDADVLDALMRRDPPDDARMAREQALADDADRAAEEADAIGEGYDTDPVLLDDHGLTADEFDASLYGLDAETFIGLAEKAPS